MSILAATTEPAHVQNRDSIVSYVAAALLVVMSTAQLYSYEDFPSVLWSYSLLGSLATVKLISALLVTAEVFSLPFLFRMRVSPLMRSFSLVSGLIVSVFWMILSLWLVLTDNSITNGGILGATISISAGTGQLIVSIILFLLMLYVAYRLWPLRPRHT